MERSVHNHSSCRPGIPKPTGHCQLELAHIELELAHIELELAHTEPELAHPIRGAQVPVRGLELELEEVWAAAQVVQLGRRPWVAVEVRKLHTVEAQAVQVKAEVKEEVASPEPAPADIHLRSALFDAATLEEIKLEGQVNDWLVPAEKCSECAVSAYGFCHCDNCTGSY